MCTLFLASLIINQRLILHVTALLSAGSVFFFGESVQVCTRLYMCLCIYYLLNSITFAISVEALGVVVFST